MKKQIQLIVLSLISWLILGDLQAQQDAMFTKYMFNSLVYNPAYAGSRGYTNAVLLYRDQWMGWGSDTPDDARGGAPITQTFSVNRPVKKRVGLGLNIINDQVGAHRSTGITLNYAYRVNFGNGKLGIGIQAGADYWRADWSALSYKDAQATDPAFLESNTRGWVPDVGTGVYFNSELFYAGFSVLHIGNFDLPRALQSSSTVRSAVRYPHYYFTIGGAIPISGRDLMFKPSLLIKSVGLFRDFIGEGATLNPIGAPTEFDIDLSFLFFETFWIGTSFRAAFEGVLGDTSSVDSADIWMSFQLRNGLRIGGAYDYTLTPIQNYTTGSFELMLGYDFYYQTQRVNSPRYF